MLFDIHGTVTALREVISKETDVWDVDLSSTANSTKSNMDWNSYFYRPILTNSPFKQFRF